MDSPPPTSPTAATRTPSSTIAPFASGIEGLNQTNNLLLSYVLWGSLGFVVVLIITVRLLEIRWARVRKLSTVGVSRHTQTYWKYSQWRLMPGLKKRLIYAPLFGKRHSQRFTLQSGANLSFPTVSFGALPSRLHTIFLLLYVGSTLGYTFVLDWQQENKYALYAELRGRSGTMAAVNMMPLVILAARNNPLIGLLKLSFDTCNLIHRWVGRLVVIETLIHASVWAVVRVADKGYLVAMNDILRDQSIAPATIGTIALVMIFMTAISPIRSFCYEAFLNLHIFLAIVAFLFSLLHCYAAGIALPQSYWILTAVCLWFIERIVRTARILYCNWSGRNVTIAVVEPMQGTTTCRVTMYLPRRVEIKPGSHAFIRFVGVRPWETHPFSIAWSQVIDQKRLLTTNIASPKDEDDGGEEKTRTAVSFVVGSRTGFTRQLFKTARPCMSGRFEVLASFEGPYGGHHDLGSYGHIVLFAGGTGITHQLSYLSRLVRASDDVTAACRVVLVWVMRDSHAIEWVRPFIDDILAVPNADPVVRIDMYVTRAKTSTDLISGWEEENDIRPRRSAVVTMTTGRPDALDLLRQEMRQQVGAMCVTVCGPGALADDVRAAVRVVQDRGQVVDFVEESFTW
jgi:predicted ferric reductase